MKGGPPKAFALGLLGALLLGACSASPQRHAQRSAPPKAVVAAPALPATLPGYTLVARETATSAAELVALTEGEAASLAREKTVQGLEGARFEAGVVERFQARGGPLALVVEALRFRNSYDARAYVFRIGLALQSGAQVLPFPVGELGNVFAAKSPQGRSAALTKKGAVVLLVEATPATAPAAVEAAKKAATALYAPLSP